MLENSWKPEPGGLRAWLYSVPGSVIYGITVNILFALIFFLPFTGQNLAFAASREHMRFTSNWWLSLIYFGIAGSILGGIRFWIARQDKNSLDYSNTGNYILILCGCAVCIGLGLWRFNPAAQCMLETCRGFFLGIYGVVLMAYSLVMAWGLIPNRMWWGIFLSSVAVVGVILVMLSVSASIDSHFGC